MRERKNIKRFYIATGSITLSLIVALNLVLPNINSSIRYDRFWTNKIDTCQKYDIIICGDSRVYRGIDPEIIEVQTNLSCMNMGFSSAGLSDDYLQFCKKKLKSDSGIMIIGLTVNSIRSSSMKNGHLNSLLKMTSTDKWLAKNTYPYLESFGVYPLNQLFKAAQGHIYLENYHVNSGFVASDYTDPDSGLAIPLYKSEFEVEKYRAENEELLVQSIKNIVASGVRVIICRMQGSHAMTVLEDEYSGNGMKGLMEKLKGVGAEVLEAPINEKLHTYDGSHLNAESARRLSHLFAQYLN